MVQLIADLLQMRVHVSQTIYKAAVQFEGAYIATRPPTAHDGFPVDNAALPRHVHGGLGHFCKVCVR